MGAQLRRGTPSQSQVSLNERVAIIQAKARSQTHHLRLAGHIHPLFDGLHTKYLRIYFGLVSDCLELHFLFHRFSILLSQLFSCLFHVNLNQSNTHNIADDVTDFVRHSGIHSI